MPAAGTPIRALQLIEMRGAIQELWDNAGMGAIPNWMSGVWPGGPSTGTTATPIYGSDTADLRVWLNRYEYAQLFDPQAEQGLDSKSYDLLDGRKPLIQDSPAGTPETNPGPPPGNDWAQDVLDASANKATWVRCNIVGPAGGAGFSDTDLSRFRIAFSPTDGRYGAKNLHVFAVLGWQFYSATSPDRNEGLVSNPDDPDFFTNQYIRNFADRAAALADDFATVGVHDFIIWNEPYGSDRPFDAEHFAALLRRCRQKVASNLRLYWGGIFFSNQVPQPDQGAVDYIHNVYEALSLNGLAGNGHGPWPWDGINVHIHHARDPLQMDATFLKIEEERTQRGDTGGAFLLGEWGVTFSEQSTDPNALANAYDALRPHGEIDNRPARPFPTHMSYFSHHYANEGADVWGLRFWTADPGNPGIFRLGDPPPGGPGFKTPLYDAYTAVFTG